MKIIGICGSPRKKNTWFMMQEVLKSAEACGAETELIALSETDMKNCTGCIICEEKGNCVIDDGMRDILEKIKKADVLFLGSPSYYNNVTGLMKTFIDRTNPMWKELVFKGKKAAVVCTGAQNVNIIQKCTNILIDYLDIMEMELLGSVTAKDSELKAEAVINELKKLGEKIAGK